MAGDSAGLGSGLLGGRWELGCGVGAQPGGRDKTAASRKRANGKGRVGAPKPHPIRRRLGCLAHCVPEPVLPAQHCSSRMLPADRGQTGRAAQRVIGADMRAFPQPTAHSSDPTPDSHAGYYSHLFVSAVAASCLCPLRASFKLARMLAMHALPDQLHGAAACAALDRPSVRSWTRWSLQAAAYRNH